MLVTGASGFIGSHVVDKLLAYASKFYVVGFDLWFNDKDLTHQKNSYSFQFVRGSILNDSILKEIIKDVDVVIHMAAILGTSETIEKYSPLNVAYTNIIGTIKILEYSLKHSVKKVILTSTPDVPWLNPYKISKYAMEKFALIYNQYYGLKSIVLKLSNVYGPRERWSSSNLNAPYSYQKVVSTFIVNALQNKPLPIYGDGEQRSDYVYVEDVAEAFIKAIDTDNAVGHVIPIGTGRQTSVNELADLVIKLTNSRSRKLYLPMRRGEIPLDICVDTYLAKELLGFKAETLLSMGLEKTIPYYRRKIVEVTKH